jgi:hypothetical protein
LLLEIVSEIGRLWEVVPVQCPSYAGKGAAEIVKLNALEAPAGEETEMFTDPAATLDPMETVALTCVALARTLLTVMPADGNTCTAVTPER